jgi:fatty-acyl-CoA synthase
MLQRMLALGDDEIHVRDLSSLRIVFSAGSHLPAEVAISTMDALGEVIYNLYGSTEVALATMTTPEDVRAAPTSVGRPLLGSRVRILDEHGRALSQCQTSRIFVGTLSPFEGYTSGERRSSMACSLPVTSGTSTQPGGCSSMAATTR